MYAQEPYSRSVRNWVEAVDRTLLIGDLAKLEFAAAMSRGLRIRKVDIVQVDRAFENFGRFLLLCGTISHTPSDFARAESLVRDFATKLAGPDALHIATAIGRRAALLTLDERKADAARMKGIEVIDVA